MAYNPKTLAVAQGGTSSTSLTAHNLVVGNGTSAPSLVAPSATSGVPLVSAGASADPAYGTTVVAGGGTGDTSFTAYAVICGGTTSTGALQSVASVGSGGQVLTSNGAGALPTFQSPGASLTGYTQTHGTALGVGTGVTGGDYNTFIGYNAGNANSSGAQNTCLGAIAGAGITSGANNIFIGVNAGKGINTGHENCCIGLNAGQLMSTGSDNIIIGQNTAQNYTGAESGNIVIGAGVAGVNGESNVLHIGDTGGSITSAYIAGIAGVTVASSAAVLINTSTKQLGTVVSSERFKENIEDIGHESEIIYQLRPVKFTLKEHPEYGIQTGLIAEEVQKVAPRLVSFDKEGKPASVAYHELPALLLAEIQKLRSRIEALEAK